MSERSTSELRPAPSAYQVKLFLQVVKPQTAVLLTSKNIIYLFIIFLKLYFDLEIL